MVSLSFIWAQSSSFSDLTVNILKNEFHQTQFGQQWTKVVLFWNIPKPSVTTKSKIAIWIGLQQIKNISPAYMIWS